MTMTPEQLSSLDRSARRAVARRGDGDEKLSLYIRVAESRIYNGKPVLKALLKEVIFLRLTDLHENDTRIPKHTPWSKEYRKYEGWFYSGQDYLATRVGCEYTYASKALKKIIKHGYLKTRKWRGKNGAWHKQYLPDEAFIDAAIAELDAEVAAELESADKSVVTPLLSLKQVATCPDDNSPLVIKAGSHLSLCPEPLAISAGKEVSLGWFSEVVDLGGSLSTPPSGNVKSGNPNQEKATPTPLGLGVGKAKTNPKATPQPGYDCCQDCGSTEQGHVCIRFDEEEA
jgi:hypothetical protein